MAAGAELVFNVTMAGNSLGDKDWCASKALGFSLKGTTDLHAL